MSLDSEGAIPMVKRACAVELINGDVLEALAKLPDAHFQLVISSPPYNINKPYERDTRRSFDEYLAWQRLVIAALTPKISTNGSVCWQVGNYLREGEVFPLDAHFYEIFKSLGFKLRNRIIWRFNFGLNAEKRFSGRHETLLWFTKSDDYKFNLDPVRVPQLYPGKRHSAKKGKLAGKPSGNPLGKNPSDFWEFSAQRDFKENPVWEFPNVKANHPEKTAHPCQFPIELAERCVLALSDKRDRILDPFVGTGASLIAAQKHGRASVGIDKEPKFLAIAARRLRALEKGKLSMREMGKPVRSPSPTEGVARRPAEWSRQAKRARP